MATTTNTPCPSCGVELTESVYTADQRHKSCPGCSVQKGRHAFRPVEEFGIRTVGGREYIQSHCPPCRAKQPAGAPLFTC